VKRKIMSDYPEFRFGITGNRRFSGIALAVQQHEVRLSRVAALQCVALFAALKKANMDYSSELRSLKQRIG
jgi:hypothetical protein